MRRPQHNCHRGHLDTSELKAIRDLKLNKIIMLRAELGGTVTVAHALLTTLGLITPDSHKSELAQQAKLVPTPALPFMELVDSILRPTAA